MPTLLIYFNIYCVILYNLRHVIGTKFEKQMFRGVFSVMIKFINLFILKRNSWCICSFLNYTIVSLTSC